MIVAASTVELGLRMGVGLALFLALAWGTTRLARQRVGSFGRDADLSIRSRQQLTKSASVAVLRAGNRHFLVGVSDGGVSVLAEGDDLLLSSADGGDAVEEILDVRAGDLRTRADGLAKSGAGTRHGRTDRPASTGMGVIEALRERTVRRI